MSNRDTWGVMTRDMETHPYSAEEERVAEFFSEMGIGGGDDPIGALIASHIGLHMLTVRRSWRHRAKVWLLRHIHAAVPTCTLWRTTSGGFSYYFVFYPSWRVAHQQVTEAGGKA